MINALALGLVLTSLAAAGVWTPARTDKPVPAAGGGLVKEGHRLLVVEYERLVTESAAAAQDRTTAAIHKAALTHEEDIMREAREKLLEAAEVLPNLGQGVSTPQVTGGEAAGDEGGLPSTPAVASKTGHGVKEKICDAYGVCREKVTGLFGKPVEKAGEAAAGVKHGVRDAAAGVKHGVEDAAAEVSEKARRVKEEVTRKAARGVEDTAKGVKEGVKGAIHGAAEKAREAKEGTEGAVSHAAGKAKEVKDEVEDTVAKKARGVKDTAEQAKEAVKGNASMMAKDAAEKARLAGEETREDLTDILARARHVFLDAASYLASSALWGASHTLVPAAHLLAFATAYGTCVWVTFVSSHVLAGALPRQQFGVVQSRLYPAYFRTMAYSLAAALVAYYFSAATTKGQWKAESGHVYNLLGALGLVLGNMLLLEPRATKVMFESMRVEKEEGRGITGGDVSGSTGAAAATTTASTDVDTPEAVPARTTRRTTEVTATTAPATAPAGKVTSGDTSLREVGKLHKKLKNLNSYSSLLNILTLMTLTWHLVHLSRRLLPREEYGGRPC